MAWATRSGWAWATLPPIEASGAADDQQPAIAGALGAAAGAADDPEHAVDGRPVGHHRDGGGLPPAVAGLDAQGVQRGGRDRIGADGDDHGHGHPQLQGDPVQPGHAASGWTRRAGRRGGWPPVWADRPGAVALGVGEGLHQAAASPSSVGRSTSTGARSSTCHGRVRHGGVHGHGQGDQAAGAEPGPQPDPDRRQMPIHQQGPPRLELPQRLRRQQPPIGRRLGQRGAAVPAGRLRGLGARPRPRPAWRPARGRPGRPGRTAAAWPDARSARSRRGGRSGAGAGPRRARWSAAGCPGRGRWWPAGGAS